MSRWWLLTSALVLALGLPGWAMQEDPFRPPEDPKEEEEDGLTPAQAMELLKEARVLMEKAAELLNDSSRGKALETEEELRKKLEQLFKDDPATLQKKVMEKINKILEKVKSQQKGVVEKIDEILKKARA